MDKKTIIMIVVGCVVSGLISFSIGVGTGRVNYPITEYITECKTEYKYIYTEDKKPEVAYKSKGEFVVTAYCCENYPHICNNGDSTYTATGTLTTAGRTIAVDPAVIPFGTKVVINGKEYIAEDTGGHIKGNRIDICFDTHEEALQFGKRTLEVYVSE